VAQAPRKKLSKRETSYTPRAAMASETCDRCVHWRPPDACHIVAGTIGAKAWCDRFIRRANR